MRRGDRDLLALDVVPRVIDATRRPSRPSRPADGRPPPPSSSPWPQRRRRSTATRPPLMGCVSGQRSPTTPAASAAADVCTARPPLDPAAVIRDRHSPRPSKYYRPTLSVYSDQVPLYHCYIPG